MEETAPEGRQREQDERARATTGLETTDLVGDSAAGDATTSVEEAEADVDAKQSKVSRGR